MSESGIGGNPAEGKRNLQAAALLALMLTFTSVSFFSLVTRPVACFPGDIGTLKCPFTGSVGSPVHKSSAVFLNAFSTSSTTFVSTGEGLSIVRQASQNISVMMSSTMLNSVAGALGGVVRIMESSTGIPSANSALPVGDCLLDSSHVGNTNSGGVTATASVAITDLDFPGNCVSTTGTIFYYLALETLTAASTETISSFAEGELVAIIVF